MKLINNKKGVFVGTGVKILIAIVIGALLLGSTYVLASGTILPTVQSKLETLFDYSGGEVKTEEKLVGDVNNDGIVDDTDVDILKSVMVHGIGDYEPSDLDVNGDGSVDAKDILEVRIILDGQNK